MSYSYEQERPKLFTELGVSILTAMRDKARELLTVSGAARADKIMNGTSGDSWVKLAALDYMVEKGDLRRVTDKDKTWGQHQVFISGRDDA